MSRITVFLALLLVPTLAWAGRDQPELSPVWGAAAVQVVVAVVTAILVGSYKRKEGQYDARLDRLEERLAATREEYVAKRDLLDMREDLRKGLRDLKEDLDRGMVGLRAELHGRGP